MVRRNIRGGGKAPLKQAQRVAKVAALAARPGTPGERQAAVAALQRVGRPPRDAGVRQRLTDAIVKKLRPPERSNRIEYDLEVSGFGARITTAGARSFVLNFRTRGGRERRYTIGGFPDWSTTAARAEARRLRRLIDEGGDPLANIEADREAPTVAELIARFEAEHLVRKRAGTAADYARILKNHVAPALKHLKVAEVTFRDVDDCTARSPRPATCTAPTASSPYCQRCSRWPSAGP